jgi:outer membrane receptor protein involved in Fe transport
MQREEDGDLIFDVDGQGLADAYASDQSGWYLQSVFQFRPRWRVGLRYDALDSGTTDIALVQSGLLPAEAFPVLLPADPERITVMLDWSPTEFSRLRAQYAWDDARATDDRDRQFFLQYLFGIGAHGAHKY